MSWENEDKELEVDYSYRGVPNRQAKKERSIWNRFWRMMTPWLHEKRELAEQFLVAKVRKEQAIAAEHAEAANRNRAEAEKLSVETEILRLGMEAKKLEMEKIRNEGEPKEVSEEKFSEELDDFYEKVRILNLKYGIEVSITNLEDDLTTEEEEEN